MNYRERVIRTVRFEPVDELPFRHAYGLMPGVLDDWHREGLPCSVRTEPEIHAYFGFDPPWSHPLPLDLGFRPPFRERVLEDTPAHCVAIDRMGRRTHVLKEYATLPRALEFPVRDRATWQDYKRRLRFSPDRVGAGLEDAVDRNVADGRLSRLSAMGFYWFPRDLMGDEDLCLAYHDDPELITDILETWCRLIEQVLEAALERVRLDVVHLNEDMAYKTASMVGPDTFRRFVEPYYRRIQRLVDRYEVPVFSVDTDGCLRELMPWFSDCGVNLMGPNEVQAGNDIGAYRRRFGRDMAFDGGLEKQTLLRGADAVDAMLDEAIPPMKESGGGWIVCLDHRVVRGTPLATFQHYIQRTREMNRF